MKPYKIGITTIFLILVVGIASASVFSVVGPNAILTTMQLRTIDTTTGAVSPSAVLGTDTKNSVLGVALVQLTNSGHSDMASLQTYPGSTVLISDDFAGSTTIMQTSTKEGYPLLEVYYGYQRSYLQPWQYYFRIEQIDKDNAYVIMGDFDKKTVELKTIPRSTYDTMISSGKIPAWNELL